MRSYHFLHWAYHFSQMQWWTPVTMSRPRPHCSARIVKTEMRAMRRVNKQRWVCGFYVFRPPSRAVLVFLFSTPTWTPSEFVRTSIYIHCADSRLLLHRWTLRQLRSLRLCVYSPTNYAQRTSLHHCGHCVLSATAVSTSDGNKNCSSLEFNVLGFFCSVQFCV